jgi:hypothetical protein
MSGKEAGKLGGLVHRKLVRELAMRNPDVTLTAIGKKYNVTPSAITAFSRRNADEIQAVADEADKEFAGILIAQKEFRLRAYQEIFEQASEPQPKVTPAGKVVERFNEETGKDEIVTEIDHRAKMQALKQAAEELGQLANRITLQGDVKNVTTYRIVNVSEDDLT